MAQVASVELSQRRWFGELERGGGGGRSGLFVVASLLIIMHKVAWAEAYNP